MTNKTLKEMITKINHEIKRVYIFLQDKPIKIPIWNAPGVNSIQYIDDKYWIESKELFTPIIEFDYYKRLPPKRIGKGVYYNSFWDKENEKSLEFLANIRGDHRLEVQDINFFGGKEKQRAYFDELLSKLVTDTICEDRLRIIWYIMNYELT